MANSVRKQFAQTMLEVGQQDPHLVVLLGDISHFALQPFAQACPGRFYNVGICEPTIVGMAAGLAKAGFHVVVHTIAPFLIERSFEQIKLDFCYQKLGGNLITVGSAFDYGNLGCTHHCYNDAALIKTLPGAQCVYPSSAVEFDVLFRQTYNNDQLTVFRLPAYEHECRFDRQTIQFGRGIKVSEGENMTIVVTGPQLKNTLDAREALADMGWDVEIIYIHTLIPLDVKLIRESVKKTRQVLTLEEHVFSGGLGADVLNAVKDIANVQVSSLCIPNEFIRDYGSYQDHCQRLGLSKEGIIQRVKNEFKLFHRQNT